MLNDHCLRTKTYGRLAGLMESILILGAALAFTPTLGFGANICRVTVSVDTSQADPTIPGKGISYNVSPVAGSCQNTDGHKLFVNQNDYVQWAVSDGTSAGTTKGVTLTVTFRHSAPDTGNHAYSGTDKTGAFPASPAQLQTNNVTYEYDIAVFDQNTNKTYTDDPKIVVGTGMNLLWEAWEDEDQARTLLTEASNDLKEAAVRDPELSSKIQEALQTLGQIADQLQKLMSTEPK